MPRSSTGDSEFDQIVDEAIERLDEGIAEDIDDVIFQLSDESIIYSMQQKIDVRQVLISKEYV